VNVPNQGLCSVCEATVRIRKDGRTYAHPQPYDPDASIVCSIIDGRVVVHSDCPGGNQPPAVLLEMTFARWLHAHAGRRDFRENQVTFLAQHMFRPCTRTRKTPADVTWARPEELHLEFHDAGGTCGWQCRYIEQAAAAYASFVDTIEGRRAA
jgi:hypothetical protein